jgi:hypothetical protein
MSQVDSNLDRIIHQALLIRINKNSRLIQMRKTQAALVCTAIDKSNPTPKIKWTEKTQIKRKMMFRKMRKESQLKLTLT